MADREMIYLDDAIDALAYFTEKSPTGRTAQEVVKYLPSAQQETLEMICGACDDCDSTVLYLTNPPQVKCKRSGKLHFVTDHCDATSAHPEIIHCRECKHWKTDHPTANGYHCCHRIHNVFPMREDDFCSRAERRKND